MQKRHLILTLSFILAAFLGYWLAGTAVPKIDKNRNKEDVQNAIRQAPVDDPPPKFSRGVRDQFKHGDRDAELVGALEGQRVLAFKDQAALDAFLKRAGDKIRILGRLDALNALRIGFSDYGDLLALLDGNEEQSYIFPVYTPTPEEGTVQDGAVALGNNLLKWLGIKGDNSTWGKGVLIAIIDTGVTANSAFNTNIQMINLVPLPSDLSKQNGHGTAVASQIIGNNSLTPGIAPSADILSVRIAGESGPSDSYLLAQGIIAAVDAGAGLINISMGSFGNSAIVRSAIEYATSKGTLIFAAAGNNGTDEVTYPAANKGVIAVGSVDAVNNHLDFSNSGSTLDIAAPGYGVNAAYSNDEAVSISGTSISTPIVVGCVAGLMSGAGSNNLSNWHAWQQLTSYLNDSGAAGPDEESGGGSPAIDRAITGDTPGVYDAALSSTRILPPDANYPNGQLEIVVQNRGTETLINSAVSVNLGGSTTTQNITTLAPNDVTTVRVPISRAPTANVTTMNVDAQVTLSGGVVDAIPSNDRRVETYASKSVP